MSNVAHLITIVEPEIKPTITECHMFNSGVWNYIYAL